MDIYLKEIANNKKSFRFPSLPDKEIDIKRETQYQEYNFIGTGRRSYPKGISSEPISWSGYFWGSPRKNNGLLNRKWIDPDDCVKKLRNWHTKGTPLNLVISGIINIDVTIKSFNCKPFGGYGDYKYEITFIPYYQLKIFTTKELGLQSKSKSKKKKKTTRSSSTKKTTSKTYKIVSGDTLWGIAKKKYNNGNKWTTIYKANKTVIENAAKRYGRKNSDNGHWIYPGTVLTIP